MRAQAVDAYRSGTLLAAVVMAATMCAPGAAASAEKTRWREARTSAAQLEISMRERFDDKPGLVQVEGFVPGAGSYFVFVTARSPENACRRFPPEAARGQGVGVPEGAFTTATDPFTHDGRSVADSRIRACGYLVRSQNDDGLLNPIVVARAQAVGTPLRDPGALTLAIIAAIMLGIVLLVARWALRRARRPAAERRATGVAWPPPARRGPTPTAPRSPRAPTRRPPPATVAKQRCRWHNNKVVYATQAEAQDWVDYTRRRDAAGTWEGQPMDHCYECPAVGGHWHVTKQPRRSW